MKAVILGGLVLAFLASATAAEDVREGRETSLPIPRFVSIKAAEANVRRGPGLTHRIDWVYKRRHLPVQVTDEYGHWRRVRDIEGAGGWIHYSLLSGARYVLVTTDFAPLHKDPSAAAREVARAEAGVVARLSECRDGWCEITAGRTDGWIRRDQIWGIGKQD